MYNRYEINADTLAIISVDDNISKIIEINDTFIVNRKTLKIIDDSCKFFGSSYEGRHQGTKNLIGVNYKSPIFIEETRSIIFFPTSSPRFSGCHWISLNNIKECEKFNNISKIIFKNDKEICLNISYESLKNQILRASILESTLRKRINLKKRFKSFFLYNFMI